MILPQLAATGIDATIIHKKTGWQVLWGPVYAHDIRAYVEGGLAKPPGMRQVGFPWTERVEMAVAWAFPLSVVAVLIVLPFWRAAVLPLVAAVWGLSLLAFLLFPLYRRWLAAKGRRVGFVLFDFGRGGLQLVLWGTFLLALVGYTRFTGEFAWGETLCWALASAVVVLVLSLDLTGSTPVYKSGLHEDRFLAITVDESKCRGFIACVQVCPKECFLMDEARNVVTIPRADQCVQCGACVVQCPFDALYFQTPGGEVIPPETIGQYKLNMLGKRPAKSG